MPPVHAPDRFPELLRESGLRVTRPRIAVLGAVQTLSHADTETIISAARRELPTVSHQAVYDSLSALTQAGLLRRIQPAGTVARYESRVDDNHHHAICRSCGRIEDVDCPVGENPCLHPDLHALPSGGFSLESAEIIYWGLCAACAVVLPPSSSRTNSDPEGSS